MSRPTKPWFRKSNKKWYVWHDGKQVNLGPDKKEAHQKFHQLMAEPKKARVIVNSGSLIELVDSFLEWWWIGSELPDGVAKEADPLQQDTCYWNAITRCIGKSNVLRRLCSTGRNPRLHTSATCMVHSRRRATDRRNLADTQRLVVFRNSIRDSGNDSAAGWVELEIGRRHNAGLSVE